MNKTILTIIVLIIIASGTYFYFTRPVAAPQQDIQSVTENSVSEDELASNQKLYRVAQDKTTLKFTIQEDLRGKPFTVVGETNQVASDIVIEEDNTVNIGKISIDARTLKTDSSQRDGAINRFILKTETEGNQYITFTAKGPVTLSEKIVSGKPFTFVVDGTFMISGISKPGTLNVTATQTTDALTGTVTTKLKRSDYNLVIPNIPFVANVPDDFTATAVFTASQVK